MRDLLVMKKPRRLGAGGAMKLESDIDYCQL